jgi:hypothetical protein
VRRDQCDFCGCSAVPWAVDGEAIKNMLISYPFSSCMTSQKFRDVG